MIKKILIANRAEIACRIIKTAKKMGITTVAIYSDADATARHTTLADEAYHVGPSPSIESYLDYQKIIAIAKKTNSNAIHPGYGFLSENANFAKACDDANIIFIGPPIDAILQMGSKSEAKQIMEKACVPFVPGYHGEKQESSFLKHEAKKIGYPVMIKAAAGGGGKGIRIVTKPKEFEDALTSAKREAKASFNDDKILIEKYISKPRHIEFQIFSDTHGNFVHLFERDCSIQRRHQKIIEEAPAPNLSEAIRKQMGAVAIKAAQAINYVGAGTVEFLLDENEKFYFMEVNTRLQVEHPVTEMITGFDLVEWQIRVANGEKLPASQNEIKIKGHAIEVRIYAEDPANHFLPSIGTIAYLNQPHASKNIRIDTGVTQGDEITPFYDPMISKLIAWGESREDARIHLIEALKNYHLIGLKNNISFLNSIINNEVYQKAEIDTAFIEIHNDELFAEIVPISSELIALACLMTLQQQSDSIQSHKLQQEPFSPWNINDGWRLNLTSQQTLRFYAVDGESRHEIIAKINFSKDNHDIRINERSFNSKHYKHDEKQSSSAIINGQSIKATMINHKDTLHIFADKYHFQLEHYNPALAYENEDEVSNSMNAPMPGTVVAIFKKNGMSVERGDNLLVIEAMKMEHTIKASAKGIIKAVHYGVGDMVNEGSELVTFESE